MSLRHYVSKQFDSHYKQTLPKKKWSLVGTYGKLNANVGGGALPYTSEVMAQVDGLYIVGVAVRIRKALVGKQFLLRFVRNYTTDHNDFGSTEKTLTRGGNWLSHAYPVYLKAGTRISIEVWHDSWSAVTMEFAQLKLGLIAEHVK